MNKRGEGVSRFSVESFLSHSAENFVGKPFGVSPISGTEKVNEKKGGGGIKIFRRKHIVSQCRKFP